MYSMYRRRRRQTLLCALCGQEITEGEEYWFCSGSSVCAGCLPDLAPCREIRGREAVR